MQNIQQFIVANNNFYFKHYDQHQFQELLNSIQLEELSHWEINFQEAMLHEKIGYSYAVI